MFSSNSLESSKTMVAASLAGAFLFNSYASIDADDIMASQSDVAYVSSLIVDRTWTSNGEASQSSSAESADLMRGISDIIADMKVFLGLPNKDIADIFGVTRQTLHAYKNGSDQQHNISTLTLARAHELDTLLRSVRSYFDRSPGAMSKNFMYEGQSLLSLLKEKDIDQDKFVAVASKLAEKMSGHSAHLANTNETTLFQMTSSS